MVQKIQDFVKEYLQRLQVLSILPKSMYGRQMLREDGGLNTSFLYYIFCDEPLAIYFLQRSKIASE
jgi:hypothetical protein